MRTNSVLSYILLGLEEAGWNVNKIETLKAINKYKIPMKWMTAPFSELNSLKPKLTS